MRLPSDSPKPVAAAPVQPRTVAPQGPDSGQAPAPDKGPDWVKDAIFYQVFPDRFKDGDPSNNPAGTAPWGSPPQNDNWFMGGDLKGVEDGLDHIQKLGANAIYMNPIFTSPSSHRYNITDYAAVDPSLGGDKAFESLTNKLNANGVRLILDGVLNHTSNEHVWFKDVQEKGPESKYWSWYNVHRHPIQTWKDDQGVLRTNDYEGWGKAEWGGPYATMPVLKHDNPAVMDALITGENSVMRKWLQGGKVDGWRMDAADEIEGPVWETARKVARETNPESYMVAENWHDASGMLQGNQFDGAVNYKYFQQPALDFFARKGISSDDFVNRLKNGYSKDAKLSMMNILESHDTPRFITEAGGDWYRARPAAIFQLTYQGAPSIYYGAEIGMEGGKDPDSRRAFDWDSAAKADAGAGVHGLHPGQPKHAMGGDKATQLTALYRTLIETRKDSDALRRGDFDVVATHNSNSTLAFRRSLKDDPNDVLVAINNDTRGHDVTIPTSGFAPDGTSYQDALTGATFTAKDGKLVLPNLDGNFGAVLRRKV